MADLVKGKTEFEISGFLAKTISEWGIRLAKTRVFSEADILAARNGNVYDLRLIETDNYEPHIVAI